MYTSIFPNPTKGSFSIVIHNNLYESISITIYSRSGQIVFSNDFKADKWFEEQIDLSGYVNGVYIVILNSGNTILYNGEIIIEE